MCSCRTRCLQGTVILYLGVWDFVNKSSYISACLPSADFKFDSGATDSSSDRSYAGTEMVEFAGGNAIFNGNGMINIYRFSMDDFAEGLVLSLKVTPSASGKVLHCYNSEHPFYLGRVISMTVTPSASGKVLHCYNSEHP